MFQVFAFFSLLVWIVFCLDITSGTSTAAAPPTPLAMTAIKDQSLVTARVGSTAHIPCNLNPTSNPPGLSIPDDFITLILFYKDDMGGAPIFTIDARARSLGSAPHISSQVLEGRTSFDLTSSPAVLNIKSVTKEDDGLYKCRVDYRRGRTVSTTTYLSVIGKCVPCRL